MRFLLFCSFFLLVACGATDPAPTLVDDRPNIIFILADDMGYSDIGCYGGEIRTPHLDRLAANGLRYRHFYNAARCCPTRASLLTGRYPHAAGMGRMVSAPGAARPPGPYQGFLRSDVPTVAEHLRSAGYATYMSGKWHVGEAAENWPLRRGFDRYFGLISGASSYYTIRRDQKRHREMVLDSLPWEPPTGENWYATTAYSDFAVDVVNEHFAQESPAPFFLYLAYTAPHWPLHAPEHTVAGYDGMYQAGWDSLRVARFRRQKAIGLVSQDAQLPATDDSVTPWEEVNEQDQWIRLMQVYAAMVEEMDSGIGRLVTRLEEAGKLDNTVIMFLSDNGGCAETVEGRQLNLEGTIPGQPGSYVAYGPPWASVSNVPFRKYKKWTEEGGIATPLVVHWPERIDVGERGGWRNNVGHVIDLLPTALQTAGVTVPAELPGQSLLATFAADHPAAERDIYWEHFGKRALRAGNWKIIGAEKNGPWELYNLATDPSETDNLAAEHPALLDSLGRKYETWAANQGVNKSVR